MPTVCFRCSEAEQIEIHDRARGNVSEYLRGIVFERSDPNQALDLILQRLEERPENGPQEAGLDERSKAILVELLLIMRATAKPQTLREAQAEVERLGFEVWSSDE